MRAVSSGKNKERKRRSAGYILERQNNFSRRKSSKSLSKLSNNNVDLIEGSSIDRRGGVFIVLLKETGCGARSNQSESLKSPSVRTPQEKFTDLFEFLNLVF